MKICKLPTASVRFDFIPLHTTLFFRGKLGTYIRGPAHNVGLVFFPVLTDCSASQIRQTF